MLSHDPFQGIEARRPKSGRTPRSDQSSKMEIVPKMARRRGSDAGQSRRWVRFCSWCPQALQEESPFVYSYKTCIGKKTKEGCDRSSKVRTVHNGRDGKGQLSWGNRRILAEGIVRKISSPCKIADMPYLCNDRG